MIPIARLSSLSKIVSVLSECGKRITTQSKVLARSHNYDHEPMLRMAAIPQVTEFYAEKSWHDTLKSYIYSPVSIVSFVLIS